MTMTELEALKVVLSLAVAGAKGLADSGANGAANTAATACGLVQTLIDKAEEGGKTDYGVADMARKVLEEQGTYIWQSLTVDEVVDKLTEGYDHDPDSIDMALVRAACDTAVDKCECTSFDYLLDYVAEKYEEYKLMYEKNEEGKYS
jgi:hypothetical protein